MSKKFNPVNPFNDGTVEFSEDEDHDPTIEEPSEDSFVMGQMDSFIDEFGID